MKVKNGRVVYTLAERPVAEPGTAACPTGDLDGNGSDDDDQPVLHYWDKSLVLPVNLGRRVDGVAMSDGWIAAASYTPGGPQLRVHQICTPMLSCDWITPNFGGDFRLMDGDPAVAGGLVGALAVEASGEEQGVDLNGDGDAGDHVLQLYDATKKKVINTELAATDFVMGERATSACGDVQLTALRVRELGQDNADLNGDGDTDDRVMAVYDAVSGTARIIGQAATPCTFPACDPRTPYRVSGSTITFLTAEAEQGGQDLSGEGHTDDVVVQVYDFCGNVVTLIGPVDAGCAARPDGSGREHHDHPRRGRPLRRRRVHARRRRVRAGRALRARSLRGRLRPLRAPHVDSVRDRRRLPPLHPARAGKLPRRRATVRPARPARSSS